MSCRYCDGFGVIGFARREPGKPCDECSGTGLSPVGQAVRRTQEADTRRILQVVELGPVSGDGLARGYASGAYTRPSVDIWHVAKREPGEYVPPKIVRTATGFAVYR